MAPQSKLPPGSRREGAELKSPASRPWRITPPLAGKSVNSASLQTLLNDPPKAHVRARTGAVTHRNTVPRTPYAPSRIPFGAGLAVPLLYGFLAYPSVGRARRPVGILATSRNGVRLMRFPPDSPRGL
jgi:hypothetical protein